jgi:hypothetical protein
MTDNDQLMKKFTVNQLLVLAGLQLLDVLSTLIFLRLGLHEANWLVSSADDPLARMIEIKLVFLAYTTWVATRRYHSVIFQRLLTVAVTAYMLVVIWNLWGIMQALKVL